MRYESGTYVREGVRKRRALRAAAAVFCALLLCLTALTGCDKEKTGYPYDHELNVPDDRARTYYEIFVASFADGNGDGKGDLSGLVSKLDYLNDGDPATHDDLGINGIWLMPINPSPSYHKYDVTDYKAVDPDYGTMADFEKLIEECGKRGIRVQMDLVLNHSSSSHPWFRAALEGVKAGETAADNKYVDYYVFRQAPDTNYHNAGDGIYYEGKFNSDMPDFNMNSLALREDIKDIAAFWLNKGVSGFRLDAAKHVYNNTEDNVTFWTWFNDYCKSVKSDCYNVSEVWGDPENTMAEYFASGMSVFNYGFATSTGEFSSTVSYGSGDGYKLSRHLQSYQQLIRSKDEAAVASNFLSNHDNDRSAGYFIEEEQLKAAASLYLLSPGSAYIYYGEEIGMKGRGRDENKRLGFMWSETEKCDDPAAADYSGGQPYKTLADQKGKKDSIFEYYRRAVRLRNENPEIARGTLTAIESNEDVCAYTVEYEGETLLIAHNVGGETQTLAADKSAYGVDGIRGYLSATGSVPSFDGAAVTLPAYTLIILK